MRRNFPKISMVMVLLLAILYCGPAEESSKPVTEKTESLEHMLATIDKGYASKNDITITQFRSLLKYLDEAYIENKKQIADMSVTAQTLLRNKHGIKESLMNIMEGIFHVFPTTVNPSYAEYATVYVQLRAKGRSHYEAWMGVTTYLKSIGR